MYSSSFLILCSKALFLLHSVPGDHNKLKFQLNLQLTQYSTFALRHDKSNGFHIFFSQNIALVRVRKLSSCISNRSDIPTLLCNQRRLVFLVLVKVFSRFLLATPWAFWIFWNYPKWSNRYSDELVTFLKFTGISPGYPHEPHSACGQFHESAES